MSEINHIPKHWQLKKLGEVCKIFQGYGFPKNLQGIKTGEFPVYKVGDISKNVKAGFRYLELCDNFIDENTLQKLRAKPYPKHTIVFAKIGEGLKLNRRAIVKTPGIVDNNPVGLKAIEKLCNDLFLFYFLTTVKLGDYSKATTVPSVRKSEIEEIDFPLPPLPEQQAIVAKIEELFSELDNGIAQLKTAQKQLKVYRQSLLKWAFEGKLTNKKVKEGELPKGWKWVKSGELFSFVTSGSRGWAKYYSNSGAIFIRITNMNFDTLELDLRESKIQYVNPPSNSEGIRTKVQEGDFLFSITGYLGMFAIAPKMENAFVNQHVCLCRPKDGFNKKYVGYWIVAKSGGIHHLNKNQKGAVKAGLNLDDLKTFPVPLCSLEEQQLIVDELESKLTVCDKIEETICQSLQQAETLRQSILKKAFEGKLVKMKQ